ncbi:MAG TPA: hypothetical protein VGO09_02335 [Flavisolibacter sp.]|nr:hypothetical protein [Flavisolibacter sp.]
MRRITFTFQTVKDLWEFVDQQKPAHLDIKVAKKQVKCECQDGDIEIATNKYMAVIIKDIPIH